MISNFVALLQQELQRDPIQFQEVAGAKTFFEYLAQLDGIQLGIATGSWEASALIKLAAIGISVDGIAFSNSNYHKSREDITKDVIQQLEQRHQTLSPQVTYFGDGEWDFKTCQNLSIQFIGIDIDGDGKLEKLGAKKVFRDYENQEQILTCLL